MSDEAKEDAEKVQEDLPAVRLICESVWAMGKCSSGGRADQCRPDLFVSPAPTALCTDKVAN